MTAGIIPSLVSSPSHSQNQHTTCPRNPLYSMSLNSHQLPPDSPPAPVLNSIHPSPSSQGAPTLPSFGGDLQTSPLLGNNFQTTILIYQPNPPITNLLTPHSHGFGHSQIPVTSTGGSGECQGLLIVLLHYITECALQNAISDFGTSVVN